MKTKKSVGVVLVGVVVFAALAFSRVSQGRILQVEAPPGYSLSTEKEYDDQIDTWHLSKTTDLTTVKSTIRRWVGRAPGLEVALGGFKGATAIERSKNGNNMFVSDLNRFVVNDTEYLHYETQEQRRTEFVVKHYASFSVRNRSYRVNCFSFFKAKAPDSVKIADAEWRQVLLSTK